MGQVEHKKEAVPAWLVTLILTIVGGVILLAIEYKSGIFQRSGEGSIEPPFSSEELHYLDITSTAVNDAFALNLKASEALNQRISYADPNFSALTVQVMDRLGQVRSLTPSARLTEYHFGVLRFIENVHKASLLLARYSYSRDQETFNKASDLLIDGTHEIERATAELIKVKKKQGTA